jgi:hypothetical protein
MCSGKRSVANGALRFFELANVLVHLDHIARFIVKANHGIM